MEEDLIACLLAAGGVTGLAGQRVWPVLRPQGSDLPAITLSRTGGADGQVFEGRDGLVEGYLQLDSWGRTYAEAKLLARAADAAVAAWAAAGVQGAWVEAERDTIERTDTRTIFRTILDLRVWRRA